MNSPADVINAARQFYLPAENCMRLIAPTFFLLLMTALNSVAYADDMKIGYVDMARALNDVEEGKAAKAKLKADFDGKQKKLDEMQNELKAAKEDFEKKAAMMKADAKQAKQEELQKKFVELQQTYMQLQKELMDKEGAVTQDITGKLRKIVVRIGDREGYSIILDIGETVLYFKRHMELTDKVVQEYNEQYGGKK
jgi:outer membrane protein